MVAEPATAVVETAPSDPKGSAAAPGTACAAPVTEAKPAAPSPAAAVEPVAESASRRPRLGGFGLGAAALAAMALASTLPLSFTATSSLAFAVGTQPPAATVRGIAQVLGSRELARDALDKLTPAEVARLAAPGPFSALANGDGAAIAGQAARRIAPSVQVTPVNGGRSLDIAVSAPTPALAARLADAYVAAALDLEDIGRGAAGVEPASLPSLERGGGPALAPLLPDTPGPLPFTLLAAAAATLALGRMRTRREPPRQGRLDPAELPRELDVLHRITWLGGHDQTGIGVDEAVAQLLPHASGIDSRSGRLVLLSCEGMPAEADRCASALARRLAEDKGVVLVVLERAPTAAAAHLKALGCELGDPGIRELLTGRARFGETLHRDPQSRAHVIPPGHLPPGWASATGHDPGNVAPLAALLDALRQTYEFVVVANPPLAAEDTALAALDPLMVCINGDSAPATAAVESFDLLSARQFRHIVLLRLAQERPRAQPERPVAPADGVLDADLAAMLAELRPQRMAPPARTEGSRRQDADPLAPRPALRGAA